MWDLLGGEEISFEWAGLVFASRHEQCESPKLRISRTDWWNGGEEDPETFRAPRGVWTGGDHFDSRTVSWSGTLRCSDREELLEELRQLRSARGADLKVWESGFGSQVACRRGQVQVTAVSDRLATYSVMVVLDDPLISSIDELSLAPSRAVTNHGVVRARPVVSVTAPGARPTVTIGSWSTQAPRALSGSERFVVDCRTETLYIGGSAVFPILPAFPSIRPGATATISTSHGTGTVDGVSAWI